MKQITLHYGSDSRTVNVAANTTISMLLADNVNRTVLGYGDNVQGLINGVAQSGDVNPPDGSDITIENKANQKAN